MLCQKCNHSMKEKETVCLNCGHKAVLQAHTEARDAAVENIETVKKARFRSPVALIIAICFSVITLVAAVSIGLGAFNVFVKPDNSAVSVTYSIDLGAMLTLVFSALSTAFAWVLYAGKMSRGKIGAYRLYVGYAKVMNGFVMVAVIFIGLALIIGSFTIAAMQNMLKDFMVETARPMIDDAIEAREELLAGADAINDLYEDFPQEYKDLLNINDVEKFESFFRDGDIWTVIYRVDENWDKIMNVLEFNFWIIGVLALCGYVVLIVFVAIIGKSLKKTARYLRALSRDEDEEAAAPGAVAYVGGVLLILLGISEAIAVGLAGAVTAVTGLALFLLALNLNKLKKQRTEARVAAEQATEELAVVQEKTYDELERLALIAIELLKTHPYAGLEETPVEAPVEEIPVEEAPDEETPVEETPVEEAPVEEAPVEEAPAEEAPAEQAPAEE